MFLQRNPFNLPYIKDKLLMGVSVMNLLMTVVQKLKIVLIWNGWSIPSLSHSQRSRAIGN